MLTFAITRDKVTCCHMCADQLYFPSAVAEHVNMVLQVDMVVDC